MGKQVVALEDDADVLTQGAQVDIGSVDAVVADADLAGIDLLEAVDAAQRRALAGARATDQHQHLAALDCEADAVQHLERAEALMDLVEDDDGAFDDEAFLAHGYGSRQAGISFARPTPMRRSRRRLRSEIGKQSAK